jgi:hypothetical protein
MGWVVSVTPRPYFAQGKGPPVPIVQETGWVSEPVWTQMLVDKSFAPAGDRTLIARLSSVERCYTRTRRYFYTSTPKECFLLCTGTTYHYLSSRNGRNTYDENKTECYRRSCIKTRNVVVGPTLKVKAGVAYVIIHISSVTKNKLEIRCEISSSHGGEYEVQICLLGCTAQMYIPEDNCEHSHCLSVNMLIRAFNSLKPKVV